MRLVTGFITILLLTNVAMAAVQQDLKGDEGVLIQGQQYSYKIIQLLHQSALRDQKDITPQKVSDLVIENHLLANEAIQKFGEAKLLQSENRVGFPAQYLLEMQYTATAEYLYKGSIQAQSPKVDISKFIAQPFTCESQQLVKLLSLGQRQEFQLPETELHTADKFKVIQFQFPQKKLASITLGAIYRQQNVQGRIGLHSGDCHFLQSAAERRLGELYISYWMTMHSGLSDAEIQQLKMALRMRYIKDRYLAELGIAPDEHDDSDYVTAKSKTITQDEISRYYKMHRDKFKRVTKARGRHLVVNDQTRADRVYNELNSGLDFNEAIKRYSQSADEKSQQPGTVDWVYNNNKLTPWRDTLFLIMPLKQINRPLKAPTSPEWEIVMVDERVEEYQAADSEGVRYQVSQILARQAIAEEWRNTQTRLYADNLVHVNPMLFNNKSL